MDRGPGLSVRVCTVSLVCVCERADVCRICGHAIRASVRIRVFTEVRPYLHALCPHVHHCYAGLCSLQVYQGGSISHAGRGHSQHAAGWAHTPVKERVRRPMGRQKVRTIS